MEWLALAAVLVVSVVLALSWRSTRLLLLPNGSPGRLACGVNAVLLAALGFVFMRVLVFDSGDNAYLYVYWVGFWLFAASLMFAIAACLPKSTIRDRVALFAFGFLLVVGVLNAALLISGLSMVGSQDEPPIIPSQGYDSNDVFMSHLYALVGLIGALGAVVFGQRVFRA
jgi:hypothetical protein